MHEVCTTVGDVCHWLSRAVDEHGIVLDVLLQRHRDTEAARTFLARLLGEFHVPETICTDKLAGYGAAIRELPALQEVDHQQVIRAARCNHLVEQSHRPTRQQERGQLGFRKLKRTQEFLNLHARIANLQRHTRTTVPAHIRRNNQTQAFQTWSTVTAVHLPTMVSDGGNPRLLLEVTEAAMTAASPDLAAFRRAVTATPSLGGKLSLYRYRRDGAGLRARMFSPLAGTWEDAATGSAATLLAGFLLFLSGAERGAWDITQGVEMGRPSFLRSTAQRTPGGIWASVGGGCVPVLRGEAMLSAAIVL